MPLYIYQNPKTKEFIEVLQSMNEEHIHIDEHGLKWERIFTKPQASMDTQLNLHNSKEFVRKTKNKNYSLGQLWDKSAELSEKRGGNSGQDEVRRNAELKYEKRTGKKHPHAKKQTDFLI
jgi:hypothetical protein